jgi:hypothetical protein
VSTHGPRFSGDYQFPRTDAATLRHGEPILSERGLCGPWQVSIELRPLLDGLPGMFAVLSVWGGLAAPSSGSLQAIVEGEDRARRAFADGVAELRRTGKPLAAIPVPADTPMFRRRVGG